MQAQIAGEGADLSLPAFPAQLFVEDRELIAEAPLQPVRVSEFGILPLERVGGKVVNRPRVLEPAEESADRIICDQEARVTATVTAEPVPLVEASGDLRAAATIGRLRNPGQVSAVRNTRQPSNGLAKAGVSMYQYMHGEPID